MAISIIIDDAEQRNKENLYGLLFSIMLAIIVTIVKSVYIGRIDCAYCFVFFIVAMISVHTTVNLIRVFKKKTINLPSWLD